MGGNPAEETSVIHAPIHNAWKGTRGTETSKYPEEKKENSIPQVAASRTWRSLNQDACILGLRTAFKILQG